MDDVMLRDLIEDDVRRALDEGLEIYLPTFGIEAVFDFSNGQSRYEVEDCTLCMIGALMRGRSTVTGDVMADFRQLVGRSVEWVEGFVDGSTGRDRNLEVDREKEGEEFVDGILAAWGILRYLAGMDLLDPVPEAAQHETPIRLTEVIAFNTAVLAEAE